MDTPQLSELQLLYDQMCQAIGDPVRLQLLYTLHESPSYVSELAEKLDIPQPTVSRHLSTLRSCKAVKTERDGRKVIYSLTDPRIIDALNIMRDVLRSNLERELNAYE